MKRPILSVIFDFVVISGTYLNFADLRILPHSSMRAIFYPWVLDIILRKAFQKNMF